MALVEIAVADAVATVTLNRPQDRNAIGLEVAEELRDALASARDTVDVRAVVLRGAGRDFCVGGDVREFAEARDDPARAMRDLAAMFHEAVHLLWTFPAPVIAAVNGNIAGAGVSLIAASDLVVAGESSRFVLAYTGLGLTPDGGSSWTLPRIVGMRRALELALCNRVLSADEALAWGLISSVVADDAVDETVRDLAGRLAAGPTAALATTRRLLRDGAGVPFAEQLAEEARSIARAAESPDGIEGVAAFLDHREPRYHDR